MRRDAVEEFVGKIAVWVDQSDAVAGGEMLDDQVAQQRCFSRTRFADCVKMLAAVGQGNRNGADAAPNFAGADVCKMIVHDAGASRHSCIGRDIAPRRRVEVRLGVMSKPKRIASNRNNARGRAAEVMETGCDA